MEKLRDLSIGILALSVLTLAPRPAAAAEVRRGDRVHITAETTLNEDLYVAAREVVIDGVVRGDVIAAGSQVTIHGKVEGSVMAAGGSVLIDGKVGRAVRLAGGEVRINGEVGTDALVACGTCAIGASGKLGADLFAAGGNLDLAGTVARGLRAAGDKVRLAGATAAGAQVRAGSLQVDAAAAMPSLTYGAREATLSPGAHLGSVENRPEWAPARPSRFGGALLAALMALVTGGVLLWLRPGSALDVAQLIEQRPGPALLWGLVVAIAAPVLILLGMITVVAVPLSMLGVALYGFGMYFGYLASAQRIGAFLLQKAGRTVPPIAALALGIFALLLVSLLPVLGPLVSGVATLTGFGGLCLLVMDSHWFNARFRRLGASPADAHGVPPVQGAL